MKKILCGLSLLLLSSEYLHANPIAKICRGAQALEKKYTEFKANPSGAAKALTCFQLGSMSGQIDENMTFKEKARGNLPSEMLELADQMVDRAKSLRGFCDAKSEGGTLENKVCLGCRRQLKTQLAKMLGAGGLNTAIIEKACPK